MGFGVWGLGSGVWALGFVLWALGFGLWALGFGLWGLGFAFVLAFACVSHIHFLQLRGASSKLPSHGALARD